MKTIVKFYKTRSEMHNDKTFAGKTTDFGRLSPTGKRWSRVVELTDKQADKIAKSFSIKEDFLVQPDGKKVLVKTKKSRFKKNKNQIIVG